MHQMPAIVITGGAGYIGSHIAYILAQQGYQVIVLDTYIHNQHFNHSWATIIQKDYADTDVLENIFSHYPVQAVIHCAAYIEVGQSVKDPALFYENNVAKTIILLQSMLKHGIRQFIFSSSCAVYGNPQFLPLTEDHPKQPVSPYGKTKLMIETLLPDFEKAYGLQYVVLRYFNVAGALPEQELGEQHAKETHIIPLLLKATFQKKPFTIFGTDYPTKDGTAIRDYVHVLDIAQAHLQALHHLEHNNPSDYFNLGTGKGLSIKEIIDAVENTCHQKVKTLNQKRRVGDPPLLIAEQSKTQSILNWQPRYSDIGFIISSAHAFEQYHKK